MIFPAVGDANRDPPMNAVSIFSPTYPEISDNAQTIIPDNFTPIVPQTLSTTEVNAFDF